METRVPIGVGVAGAQVDSKWTPPPPRAKDLALGSSRRGSKEWGQGKREESFWFPVHAELAILSWGVFAPPTCGRSHPLGYNETPDPM